MWKAITYPFRWVFAAFDAKADGGLSMRKLVAVWCMVLIQRMNNKYLDSQKDVLGGNNNDLVSVGDFTLIPTLTLYGYIMIGICLGMIMIPQILSGLSIIMNRDSKKEDAPAAPEETKL